MREVKKRHLCLFLLLIIMVSCLGTVYVEAVNTNMPKGEKIGNYSVTATSLRAVNSFSMDIPAGKIMSAGKSISLAAGETVTIDAVYDPVTASVDFGLIAPNGLFYPVRASDGHIQATLKVPSRGKYTLAVRNNSDYEISVSGFVNY